MELIVYNKFNRIFLFGVLHGVLQKLIKVSIFCIIIKQSKAAFTLSLYPKINHKDIKTMRNINIITVGLNHDTHAEWKVCEFERFLQEESEHFTKEGLVMETRFNRACQEVRFPTGQNIRICRFNASMRVDLEVYFKEEIISGIMPSLETPHDPARSEKRIYVLADEKSETTFDKIKSHFLKPNTDIFASFTSTSAASTNPTMLVSPPNYINGLLFDQQHRLIGLDFEYLRSVNATYIREYGSLDHVAEKIRRYGFATPINQQKAFY